MSGCENFGSGGPGHENIESRIQRHTIIHSAESRIRVTNGVGENVLYRHEGLYNQKCRSNPEKVGKSESETSLSVSATWKNKGEV